MRGLVIVVVAGLGTGASAGVAADGDPAALEVLARLADADPATRRAGAEAAARAPRPLYLDPLRGRLLDPAPEVRAAAARALGALGIPRSSLDLERLLAGLARAADDPDPRAARAALHAWARYPFPEVRRRLATRARTGPGAPAARAALAAAAPAEARARLDAYLALLDAEGARPSTDPPAAPERWGVPDGSLLDAARALLGPDPRARWAAAQLVATHPDAEARRPFLKAALREPSAAVRRLAAGALAQEATAGGRAAVQALLPYLSDPDAAVRVFAASAIAAPAARSEAGVAEAAVDRLAVEPAPEARATLERAVAQQPDEPVLARLEAWTDGRDIDTQRRGVALVAARTSTAATRTLVVFVVESDKTPVQQAASLALLERPDGQVVPAALAALPATGPGRSARAYLLRALAGRTDPRIAPVLLDMLEDAKADRPLERRLEDEPEATVRPRVVALADHPQAAVRQAALRVSMRFRGPDVAEAALRALQVHPAEGQAFRLLRAQPEALRRDPYLTLLADARHADRHPQILAALREIRDPRIPGPAADAAIANPRLADDTLALLERQPADASLPALERLAAAPSVPSAARARATRQIQALAGVTRTTTTADSISEVRAEQALLPLARAEDGEVKYAARNALHGLLPTRYPSYDPYGRWPLAAEGALAGAGLMVMAAELADAELSPAFVGGAGAVLGGATPFLLTLEEDVTLGDAGFFGTYGGWGTGAGFGLGVALDLDRDGRLWSTIGGELLGVTAGSLGLLGVEWGLDDVAFANLTAAETGVLTAGITALILNEDARRTEISVGVGAIGAAASLVPLTWLTRPARAEGRLGLLATSMAHGALLGAWLPGVAQSAGMDAEDAALGVLLGQSAGYLAGMAWAQFDVELHPADAGWSFAGLAIGGATFGGLALMLEDAPSRARYALIPSGAAASALTLGLVGRRLEFHENDAWLVSLAAVGGAFAGADLSVRLEEGTLGEPGFGGGALFGLGLGTATGLVLSQFVDVSDRTLWRSLGAGGIGYAAGFALAEMIPGLGIRNEGRVAAALGATGLALAVPWAESLDLSGRNLAFASATGFGLGGLMALTPYHYAERSDGGIVAPSAAQVAGGATFGAALGVYGGLALAQTLELELRETGLVTAMTLAGAGLGGGGGLLVPDADASLPIGLAQGLGVAAYGTSAALMASGVWRPGRRGKGKRGGGTAVRLSALAAHGALHGALVPLTWRDDAAPSREVGGGLLFGASAGVLLGLGARGLGAPRLAPPDVLETSLLTTCLYAVGGGAGLVAEDRRLGVGLGQGLGLAGYAGAWLISPHTTYDPGAPFSLTIGTSAGAWLGAWASRIAIEDPTAAQQAGAALVGAGAGALGAAAWTQLQADRDDGEVFAGATAGAVSGAGLALLTGSNARGSAAWVEGGTALGLGLGLGLAPRTTFSGPDLGLVALGAGLGAYHGAFAVDLGEADADGDARGGAALLGLGLGYALAAGLSQWVEPSGADVVEIAAVDGLFQLGGIGLVAAVDGDRRGRAVAIATSSALGLTLGGLFAPRTTYETDDGVLITSAAAIGGAIGGIAVGLGGDAPSTGQRAGGVALGASAGLLTSLALSQVYRLDPGDAVEAGLAGTAGLLAGGGARILWEDASGAAEAGLVAGTGLAAWGLGLALAPQTDLDGDDRLVLGFTTGLGLWHGAWLSPMWGETSGRGRGGGAMLGAGAGYLAGYAAALLTDLDEEDLVKGGALWGVGTGLGAGLGLVLPDVSAEGTAGLMQGLGAAGLVAGLALSPHLDFEGGDYGLIAAGTALGGGLGVTFPALVGRDDPSASDRGAGALLGASAGALVTGVTALFVTPSGDDVIEASLYSLLGQGFGAGLGLAIPDASERTTFALMNGVGAGGLALGLALAPRTAYSSDALATVATTAALGGALGAMTPTYWRGGVDALSRRDAAGAALVGASAGAAVGLGLDQLGLDADRRWHATLGAGLGGLAGGGVGLAASTDDRLAVALTQGLAAAGAFGVGATLGDVEFTGEDLALGGAYVGYLTWHSMGLTFLLEGTDRQAGGIAASTVGLGALTGMYLAPYIDLTLPDTLMLLAGNVWGTWIGGWGGRLLADSLDEDLGGRRQVGLTLLSTVLGSDVGLALTGMVVGGLLDVPPTRFAYINLSGLGGMLVGMLAAGAAKGEPLKAGNVIGSLGGLVVGSVVTSFFDWSDASTWEQLLSRAPPSGAPEAATKTAGPTGFGIAHWSPSAQVVPDDRTGEPMYLFSVSGAFH